MMGALSFGLPSEILSSYLSNKLNNDASMRDGSEEFQRLGWRSQEAFRAGLPWTLH